MSSGFLAESCIVTIFQHSQCMQMAGPSAATVSQKFEDIKLVASLASAMVARHAAHYNTLFTVRQCSQLIKRQSELVGMALDGMMLLVHLRYTEKAVLAQAAPVVPTTPAVDWCSWRPR